MGYLFKAIATLAGWLALVVLALSMSAGLYLACDIAEEYASITKRWLHRGIISIIVIYIILSVDGLPVKNVLIGIVAHLSYLPLLSNFPFVQPISPITIWALFISVGNHLSWFYFFIDEYNVNYHGRNELSPLRLIGFLFLFVWVIPTGFFISLSSVEDCLPLSSGNSHNYQNHNFGDGSGRGSKKKGIFKNFIDSTKSYFFPGTEKQF